RHRNLALLSIFLILCASDPKRACQAEVIDGRLPKGISERFNTVGVDKVQGTVDPRVKPLPNILPFHPIQGKVGHEALLPLHPEVSISHFPTGEIPSIRLIPSFDYQVHGKISTSKPLPVNGGKVDHSAVHPEVNPGHSTIRPLPKHVVLPTRIPLTQRPIRV
ncbi:hypothetical protein PMAYCL1PPCAC_29771, partial [Pristionchus mayeri]